MPVCAAARQQALPYDLLIVDLLLPGKLSGLETIQHLRHALSPERLPIIVISAIGQEALEELKTSQPDVRVLRKPFKIQTLLQLVHELKAERSDGR